MDIDRIYILAALLLAFAGMVLGVYMGLAADRQLQSVHVAMLLPGFVTLAIFGFVFRLWPAMKKAPLARVQLWTAIAGALLLVVGSYFFVVRGSVPLAAIGSIVLVVANGLIVWQFWRYGHD